MPLVTIGINMALLPGQLLATLWLATACYVAFLPLSTP
jgi:hypothetical protein